MQHIKIGRRGGSRERGKGRKKSLTEKVKKRVIEASQPLSDWNNGTLLLKQKLHGGFSNVPSALRYIGILKDITWCYTY
jgi:hypothetical protein